MLKREHRLLHLEAPHEAPHGGLLYNIKSQDVDLLEALFPQSEPAYPERRLQLAPLLRQ